MAFLKCLLSVHSGAAISESSSDHNKAFQRFQNTVINKNKVNWIDYNRWMCAEI